MKNPHHLTNKLVAKIRGFGRGYVFNSTDFRNLGSRAALDQALSRLTKQGVIRRLAPGLYHYPRINPKLGGVLPPLPDAVAKAVARKTDSRVVSSGALAANVLGLTTQVPAKMIYLTDGPPRKIRVGSQTILFRYAAPRTMAVSGRISAVVFQALRHLGRDGITDSVIRRLSRTLSAKDKNILKKDIPHAVAWMRPILNQIVIESGKIVPRSIS